MEPEEEGPKRMYTLSVKIGADNWNEVLRNLEEVLHLVDERGATVDSVLGGPSGNWIVVGGYNPGQTHDKYFEDIKKWKAAREKVSRETGDSA